MSKNARMLNYRNLKEKIRLFTIAAAIIITGCTRADLSSSKTVTVIYVSDFGAVSDDGKDDTPALLAALDEIRTKKGKNTLSFAAGTYDFYMASASDANYPVTAVHKQWDFVTPFHLNGLEGSALYL